MQPSATRQSDTSSIVTIKALGDLGYEMQKGWKFYTGDNLNYALPAFDDRHWQGLDPAGAEANLPTEALNGIGWLRIKFKLANGLSRQAGLLITADPAIEIYFNGKLIEKRGQINAQLKTGRGYHDFYNVVPLNIIEGQEQLLAIRFANQRLLHYIGGDQFLSAWLVNFPQLTNQINERHETVNMLIGIASIAILICALHLIFYTTIQSSALIFILQPTRPVSLCFRCF